MKRILIEYLTLGCRYLSRHSREGGSPRQRGTWMPTCVGMTASGIILAGTLIGCSSGPEPPTMETIVTAYDRGDFGRAYEDGAIRAASSAADAATAAYLAGVSAGRLQAYDDAERLLTQAGHDGDRPLAANAYASLGLVYAEQEKFSESADAFQRAADYFTGDDRARALYFAGIAQQKLGLFEEAQDDLFEARAATTDGKLHEQIDRQMEVVAFTIQIAAYRDPEDAKRDAKRVSAKTNNLKMGPPRLVASTDARGVPVTVVQVGRFPSAPAAKRILENFNEPTAVVVPLAEPK